MIIANSDDNFLCVIFFISWRFRGTVRQGTVFARIVPHRDGLLYCGQLLVAVAATPNPFPLSNTPSIPHPTISLIVCLLRLITAPRTYVSDIQAYDMTSLNYAPLLIGFVLIIAIEAGGRLLCGHRRQNIKICSGTITFAWLPDITAQQIHRFLYQQKLITKLGHSGFLSSVNGT